MRRIVLLGSTGSIGTQTLDVVRSRRDQFGVVALAASGRNTGLLAEQVAAFLPARVAVADSEAIPALRHELAVRGVKMPQLLTGPEAAAELASSDCDVVLNAITGAAGLEPTLAALRAGRTLALANKESLVIGGRLVTDLAAPGQLVAVDSEHSAFAQALRAGRSQEVARLILTASGGPFRGRVRGELVNVTPQEAMAHPTWNMGRVITINSATLVNKGLELIEAALLYRVTLDDIVVTVHPQSVVHSMVEFSDGSTIAQASPPDMRLPIGLALTWPDRLPAAAAPCDWTRPSSWTFEPLDDATFPAVELARRAGKAAGTAPAVYNAANEVLVDAFCESRIGFLKITDLIAQCLDEHLGIGHVPDTELTLEAVLAADAAARERARELVEELS
ncbi:1-deoxy-D-xylulose-5-phosphate reductoisomerase [Arachnia rubra]|uniref:1-deoxy-D-xylulose 5-phosphate reductoisomerase n=1 Tax=Arachnia rubra TaxID=1547448 RepID=A0ABX7Y2Q9_9ACTN|nr:1-deoxy-D-xylulose-5-phosphate reductoisomerase [Arachnia rubra]MBB1576265.1 1-deoxy-D-xylulose-5-phosphate reductoisomerase [Propionibacterium sp.]MDO4644865.1 1-deoxy-D-xylulose-5-phosphate reductoisomerase [Propionibacteriaceae bacterium]QUC07218.1 1-deoxy-D-xylulose-5-phosphate reductoisomerase [Arachnia rubra]BCR81483.1 1-deoxy-D-xylulose 5-phosphate reductoisomerase [Arachnia rubra]